MNVQRLGLIAYGGLLLGLTLWPRDPAAVADLPLCLLCGSRGLADALLNVVLFLPAGIALGRGRWTRALMIGAALSGSIELLQLWVPGRHANPADVLFNLLGTGLGYQLRATASRWLRPPDRVGDMLAVAAAVAAAVAMPAIPGLSAPAPPPGPFEVEWTPNRPSLAPFPGAVLDARTGTVPVRPGPASPGGDVAGALAGHEKLQVIVRLGPPAAGLAPILMLDSADRERALVFLGVDSTDLVLRRWTRASRLRLDQPEVRAPRLLEPFAPGDTLRITVWADDGAWCFRARDRRACSPRRSVGWRYLYAMNGAPAGLVGTLDFSWLAVIALPVGYWARLPLAVGLGAPLATLWLLVSLGTPLPPAAGVLALALGLGVGLALGRAGGGRDEGSGRG